MAQLRSDVAALEIKAAHNAALETRAVAGDAAVARLAAAAHIHQQRLDAEQRRLDTLLLAEMERHFTDAWLWYVVPDHATRARHGVRSLFRLSDIMARELTATDLPVTAEMRVRWAELMAVLTQNKTGLAKLLRVINRVQDARLQYAHPAPAHPITARGMDAFVRGMLTRQTAAGHTTRDHGVLLVMGEELGRLGPDERNLMPVSLSTLDRKRAAGEQVSTDEAEEQQ
jgi:hypothetical protein